VSKHFRYTLYILHNNVHADIISVNLPKACASKGLIYLESNICHISEGLLTTVYFISKKISCYSGKVVNISRENFPGPKRSQFAKKYRRRFIISPSFK